jgi:abhydrolase domain-containing protein 4
VVKVVAGTFNPLSIIRAAGPYGPGLISKYRKDIENKFKHIYADTGVVSQYIYHLNAQDPSGETAFATLNESLGWAKNPLEERLPALKENIPVTMLYGSVGLPMMITNQFVELVDGS